MLNFCCFTFASCFAVNGLSYFSCAIATNSKCYLWINEANSDNKTIKITLSVRV